jgi:hypothetical protein
LGLIVVIIVVVSATGVLPATIFVTAPVATPVVATIVVVIATIPIAIVAIGIVVIWGNLVGDGCGGLHPLYSHNHKHHIRRIIATQCAFYADGVADFKRGQEWVIGRKLEGDIIDGDDICLNVLDIALHHNDGVGL